MNVQNILKKTALSAMMFSAVAAPAMTNADSSQNSQTAASKTQAVMAVSAEESSKLQEITMTKISDPLALAKKYAPETVADWQKTLEQYRKAFASGIKKDFVAGKAASQKEASVEKTGTYELSVPVAEAKSIYAEKITFSVDKTKDIAEEKTDKYEIAFRTGEANTGSPVSISSSTATLKDYIAGDNIGEYNLAVPAGSLTDSEDTAKEGSFSVIVPTYNASKEPTPFAKAWAALSEAEESNQADAIKKALSELLKQYKHQITEREAAAR